MPPPFRMRPLTVREQALAQEMFGAALDPAPVRILTIPLWKRAFVAGPWLIVWPAAALPADFGEAPLGVQATFVHELAHVWQAQHGVGLLRAKLKAGDSPAAYAYDLTADSNFQALNIEQQAMVVEHAFLALRGAAAPHPAELYARASSAWRARLRGALGDIHAAIGAFRSCRPPNFSHIRCDAGLWGKTFRAGRDLIEPGTTALQRRFEKKASPRRPPTRSEKDSL